MIMIAAAYLEPLTPSHRPLMAMWRKPAVVRSSHGQEAASSAAPTTVVSRPARAPRGRANTAPEGKAVVCYTTASQETARSAVATTRAQAQQSTSFS